MSTFNHIESNPTSFVSALARRVNGIVVARIVRIEQSTVVLRWPQSFAEVPAFLCLCQPDTLLVGDAVAVAFQLNDPSMPILIGPVVAGLIDSPILVPEKIVVSAGSELTLQCGKASLTLTSDGRAALRGVDVTTRASHANRIRGGNVQIN